MTVESTEDPEDPVDAVRLLRDTLASIYLYVKVDSVMRQLTTEQRDAWADAIDSTREPGDTTWRPFVRWWRDEHPPLCTTLPQGVECPGRVNVECVGCHRSGEPAHAVGPEIDPGPRTLEPLRFDGLPPFIGAVRWLVTIPWLPEPLRFVTTNPDLNVVRLLNTSTDAVSAAALVDPHGAVLAEGAWSRSAL